MTAPAPTGSAKANGLASLLDQDILVCAGSGGVGKTTISAAIALEAASRGRKTIVVTIDPAKRLANSLGLRRLTNKPRRIEKAKFETAGMASHPLYAMMLDTKTTFDELVHRYARSKKRADSILSNRFYQALSGALSGTHEYMAMEKLYELHQEGKYDLIVIDTPPTRNALDFLEAPKRVTSFLEGRLLRWFLLPALGGSKGMFRAMNFAAVTFLRVVQRIVGAEVLRDTAEFLSNFEGMYEGFKERAQEVFELLREKGTSFIVITTPTDTAVDEALFFASRLDAYGLNFAAVVVNRVHPRFDIPNFDGSGTPILDRLSQIAEDFELITKREENSLERLSREISDDQRARVPYLNAEVVDLAALKQVASHIFI